MTLSLEVPSLELCQRMKELGYPQDGSLFYWSVLKRRGEPASIIHFGYKGHGTHNKTRTLYAAPTVGELLEKTIKDSNVVWNIFYNISNGLWLIYETGILGYCTGKDLDFVDKSLSNALSKMWIHLKEQGLI